MRPVRRGASPQPQDFDPYGDAKPHLVGRLGSYCSFCERRIPTLLAVEHVQPKNLARWAHLVGRWENFLLACVNCNSTKSDTDIDLHAVLLPDRDNTFAAFSYLQDGTIRVSPGPAERMAGRTLALFGLDKPTLGDQDENGHAVALDRVSQRMEVWLIALSAKTDVEANRDNNAVKRLVIELARAHGFFSIWMNVFADDIDMRQQLIDAFPGTRQSGCFDAATTQPCTPGPNPDALASGGKA